MAVATTIKAVWDEIIASAVAVCVGSSSTTVRRVIDGIADPESQQRPFIAIELLGVRDTDAVQGKSNKEMTLKLRIAWDTPAQAPNSKAAAMMAIVDNWLDGFTLTSDGSYGLNSREWSVTAGEWDKPGAVIYADMIAKVRVTVTRGTNV